MGSGTKNQQDQRRRVVTKNQRRLVVQRLRRAELDGVRITRTDLGADLGMSGGVLGAVLDDLRERGVVCDEDHDDVSGRGSKVRYHLNHSIGRVLCFSFSQESLAVAITDLSGRIMEDGGGYVACPFDVEHDATGSIAKAVDLARETMKNTDTTGPDQLVGIAVSLPAPLNEEGIIYRGFMKEWENRQIRDELRRGLGLPPRRDAFGSPLPPVRLENDANLIGLRELRRGALRQMRRQGPVYSMIIRWAGGLGAAFVLGDDDLYRGPYRLGGEIGHIPTGGIADAADLRDTREDEYTKCERCHEYCLEALIKTPALLSHLKKKGCGFEDIHAAIDDARDHDGPARKAFAMAAQALGHKLGPIVSVLNLEWIVIDSFSTSDAYPLIVDGFKKGLEDRMTKEAFTQVKVLAATDGDTAGDKAAILGGADLVLSRDLAAWVEGRPKPLEEEATASANGKASANGTKRMSSTGKAGI